MDYARFNYVAQPGDLERGVKMTPPRFGTYDYYAVKWLYTPVYDASSPEEVYKITSQWITDAAADPVLRATASSRGRFSIRGRRAKTWVTMP